MKYIYLVWRNLLRRKFRTAMTIAAIVVSFLLFGVLMMLKMAFGMGVDVAGADRLMMMNKMSLIQPLPISYLSRIQNTPGVTLVSHSSWMGGIYQKPSTNVYEFAVDAESYFKMYPEFKVDPQQWANFMADRQGCIVGRDTATRLGWKIGDKIPIMGTFNRPKTGDGVTWEFNLDAIYDGDKNTDKTQFLFHWKYLDETRRNAQGITGWYLIKVADPSKATEISSTLDAMFANSPFETKTAPEKAVAQGFANQVGNVGFIMTSIAAVVLFTILLIAASQMALAIRERTNELAALKAMGFSDQLVLALVLAESLAVAIIGGSIGLGLAWLLSLGGDPTGGFLPIFSLPTRDLIIGAVLAVLLGLLAGFIPAMAASRLRITDAMRRN
jgi:putative ABC transport system permease protein